MNVNYQQNDVFTDQIEDITITGCTDTKVQVVVFNYSTNETIINVVLDIYNGGARFYETRATIEEYMRMRKLGVITVEIQVTGVNIQSLTDESQYRFFFVGFDYGEGVTSKFLTTRSLMVLPLSGGGGQYLNFCTTATSITGQWTMTFRNSDGSTYSRSYSKSYSKASNPIQSIYVNAGALYAIAGAYPIAATLRIGSCVMDFVLHETNSSHVFTFLNAFNVQEDICLDGVTKEKTLITKSTATCGGKESFYDIVQTQEFEFESGPLSLADATALRQLVISPEIKYNSSEILIKDHTLEIADSNEELNTVKFTFIYADNKLRFI